MNTLLYSDKSFNSEQTLYHSSTFVLSLQPDFLLRGLSLLLITQPHVGWDWMTVLTSIYPVLFCICIVFCGPQTQPGCFDLFILHSTISPSKNCFKQSGLCICPSKTQLICSKVVVFNQSSDLFGPWKCQVFLYIDIYKYMSQKLNDHRFKMLEQDNYLPKKHNNGIKHVSTDC